MANDNTPTMRQIIDRNEALFNAHDAIKNAAILNEMTFNEMLEILKSWNEIKEKNSLTKF